jgi:predicted RNA-binding Zn-ribbon protein involved in translation (DUF1610 family)
MGGPFHLIAESGISAVGPSDYAEDWKEYRRLRRKFLLIWLGFVPAVGTFAFTVNLLLRTFVPGFIFAVAWMIWFATASVEIGQFACPRCGKVFCRKERLLSVNWGLVARKCQNCGLRKFSQSSTE